MGSDDHFVSTRRSSDRGDTGHREANPGGFNSRLHTDTRDADSLRGQLIDGIRIE